MKRGAMKYRFHSAVFVRISEQREHMYSYHFKNETFLKQPVKPADSAERCGIPCIINPRGLAAQQAKLAVLKSNSIAF